MGKAIPVTLGHLNFSKRGDATTHFQAILNSYPPGSELKGQDFDDVSALLENHPEAHKKIGSGVYRLSVDYDDKGGKCFHVFRRDGTKENFSMKKCISGEHSPFTLFSNACRRTVDRELQNFKQGEFTEHQNSKGEIRCPITKTWISWDDAHVDHKAPATFSMIVSTFIQMKGIDPLKIQYDSTGTYGKEFTDTKLIAEFQDWHRKNALLRVIKSRANSERAHQGRLKPTKSDRKLT